MKILKLSIFSLLISVSVPSLAEYNNNFTARIVGILTYDDGHFLITLSKMPQGPCNDYFIIPSDVSEDARHMLLSRSLIAKNTNEEINIGYDSKNCINGWYRVHRIG